MSNQIIGFGGQPINTEQLMTPSACTFRIEYDGETNWWQVPTFTAYSGDEPIVLSS
jgi:hypothetical protein